MKLRNADFYDLAQIGFNIACFFAGFGAVVFFAGILTAAGYIIWRLHA